MENSFSHEKFIQIVDLKSIARTSICFVCSTFQYQVLFSGNRSPATKNHFTFFNVSARFTIVNRFANSFIRSVVSWQQRKIVRWMYTNENLGYDWMNCFRTWKIYTQHCIQTVAERSKAPIPCVPANRVRENKCNGGGRRRRRRRRVERTTRDDWLSAIRGSASERLLCRILVAFWTWI